MPLPRPRRFMPSWLLGRTLGVCPSRRFDDAFPARRLDFEAHLGLTSAEYAAAACFARRSELLVRAEPLGIYFLLPLLLLGLGVVDGLSWLSCSTLGSTGADDEDMFEPICGRCRSLADDRA